MTRGDDVVITMGDGRKLEGTIVIASKGGEALAIEIEAVVGSWVGGIAVMKNADGSWTAVDGTPIADIRLADVGR